MRRALSAIGAVLTGTGVLILLFVAYQLWGTGLYTARAQSDLKGEFQARVAVPEEDRATTTTVAATTSATPVPIPSPRPPTGEAVGIIRIPKIGLDSAVVEGVGVGDLRKGPGHYPETPLPGEGGNAAIAGHRTTYGAPFNRLDELVTGDEIQVTTRRGTYRYEVQDKLVVLPNRVDVLDPTPEPRLTLTTCTPKYSAARRLIVVARLAPGEPPPPPAPPPRTTEIRATTPPVALADPGLASGHSKLVTGLWGLATALVGAGWWWVVRRRRRWTTYVGGAFPFLVVLFMFYANLERLLPANF